MCCWARPSAECEWTADASLEECFRLARAMTLKAAAAGLPHGGAKSVLFADPEMPRRRKELLLRGFAGMIRELSEYIPAPDMGTDEWCMTWVRDEIGRCAGLPAELGGIPLDEIGATGRGVAIACEVACRHAGIPLAGARVAIQGFGAVGSHAARFLAQRGTVIVAVADIHGAVAAEAGLDVEALRAHSAGPGQYAASRPAASCRPRPSSRCRATSSFRRRGRTPFTPAMSTGYERGWSFRAPTCR